MGDHGLTAFARLLREYHDATADFVPPDDAVRAGDTQEPGHDDTVGHGDFGPPNVICHGDFGPWNMVWQA